jgi:hypothetical protein
VSHLIYFYNECHYTECRYAECHSAECCGAIIATNVFNKNQICVTKKKGFWNILEQSNYTCKIDYISPAFQLLKSVDTSTCKKFYCIAHPIGVTNCC